ncbi:hypothetical protein PG995_009174 [Apiospora arundinis]
MPGSTASGGSSQSNSEGFSQSNSDTIGSLLARENPKVIALEVGSKGLTDARNNCVFTNAVDWKEFTYEECKKHDGFHGLLSTPLETPGSDFQGEFPKPRFSQVDRLFRHEDGFEHQILSRDIIPSVNHALKRLALRMNKSENEAFHIGRAGRSHSKNDKTEGRKRPDWVVGRMDGDKFERIMAGESKPGKKWYPHSPVKKDPHDPDEEKEMPAARPAEDEDRPRLEEENWMKPIKQVLGYSDELGCLHSFIITEEELVVYKFEKETGPAPSTSGPERPSSGSSDTLPDNPVHSGDKSTEAVRRNPDRNKKIVVTFKSQDQGDKEKEERVYYSVKYKVIPWANHGEGKLTVRLGLFMMCVLACCPEQFSETQEEKTQEEKTQKKKKTATAANKKAPSGRGEGETSRLASGDET